MSTNDTGYAPPPPGYGPPPPGPQPRPPLRRTVGDDKVIGGVAAGIARTLGIDPILIRVAFVVLTIFGGSGIVLYLAGWLFIPQSGQARSSGERFVRDNNALVVAAAVVVGVLVLAPFLLWRIWDGGFGFGGFVLLLLAVAGVIALSRRGTDSGATDTAPSDAGPTDAGPTVAGSSQVAAASAAPATDQNHPTAVLAGVGSPTAGSPPPPPVPAWVPPTPPPPPAPKDKSVLGRLTLGVALLATGALVALDLADVVSVSAVTVLATGLAVIALGLLVGTVVGRSRGLIVAGICLVLVLVPLSAVPDDIRWNTGEGVADRTYRVETVADLDSEYALGAGSLTLDLRRLELETPVVVDASIGVGEVIVLLPPDGAVTVASDVGVGVIELPDQPDRDGVDIEQSWTRPADGAAGSIDLTLSAGLGAVTVVDNPFDARELSR